MNIQILWIFRFNPGRFYRFTILTILIAIFDCNIKSHCSNIFQYLSISFTNSILSLKFIPCTSLILNFCYIYIIFITYNNNNINLLIMTNLGKYFQPSIHRFNYSLGGSFTVQKMNDLFSKWEHIHIFHRFIHIY